MMNDILLLATADKNKPFLVPLIPIIICALDLRPANAKFIDKALDTLAQLMFDKTSRIYVEENFERILETLNKVTTNLPPESLRTLKMLKEPLEKMLTLQEVEEDAIPESPTFLFLICQAENWGKALHTARLLEDEGFDIKFCGMEADAEIVKEAYAGIIFLNEHVEEDELV